MRIGVVGNRGVVGSTLQFGFTWLGHQVFGYDIKDSNSNLKDAVNTQICYVCVPTPTNEYGNCDTSIVSEVIGEIEHIRLYGNIEYDPIVVIKSTVPPGTTDRIAKNVHLDVAFVPEFLRERCAIVDFAEMHNLLAVGTHNKHHFDLIVQSHGHFPKNIVQLTPKEAELLKYYHNAIAALRIIFANEIYDLSEKLGTNYIAIKNALVKSAQLPDKYLDVNVNMRGFAGTCLPKDTLALLKLAEDQNVDLDLLEAVIVKNQKYQPTVYPGMRA